MPAVLKLFDNHACDMQVHSFRILVLMAKRSAVTVAAAVLAFAAVPHTTATRAANQWGARAMNSYTVAGSTFSVDAVEPAEVESSQLKGSKVTKPAEAPAFASDASEGPEAESPESVVPGDLDLVEGIDGVTLGDDRFYTAYEPPADADFEVFETESEDKPALDGFEDDTHDDLVSTADAPADAPAYAGRDFEAYSPESAYDISYTFEGDRYYDPLDPVDAPEPAEYGFELNAPDSVEPEFYHAVAGFDGDMLNNVDTDTDYEAFAAESADYDAVDSVYDLDYAVEDDNAQSGMNPQLFALHPDAGDDAYDQEDEDDDKLGFMGTTVEHSADDVAVAWK